MIEMKGRKKRTREKERDQRDLKFNSDSGLSELVEVCLEESSLHKGTHWPDGIPKRNSSNSEGTSM